MVHSKFAKEAIKKMEMALLEPKASEVGTASEKQNPIPFALRFAEAPIEAALPFGTTAWCATVRTTYEATGLKADVSGSDED